jgi:hypothetical protein
VQLVVEQFLNRFNREAIGKAEGFGGADAGIHVWLFFQPADERARPWQSYVKVVDPEEQEEPVARLGVVGTCQSGMLVGTPLVETEQDRSIRVEDLPEVVVGRSRLRQA